MKDRNGRTIRWTKAVDRPLPDGHFTCHRSVIGGVHALKPNEDSMQVRTQSSRLVPFAIVFGACALSFMLGYFIRGQRAIPVNVSLTTQDNSTGIPNNGELISLSANDADSAPLLAIIEESIDPDKWLESGGTSTIVEYPSNITACTIEDIFGSREAFLEMFDDSQTEDDPFGTSADDDPFNSSVEK